MPVITKYPTRPLGYLGKRKELRRKLGSRTWDAKKLGGVIVVSQMACYPLLAGLGIVGRRHYAPQFHNAMRDRAMLLQHHETADAAGFLRGEMCSAMHHFLGEMLLGLTTKNSITGEPAPVDFVLETEFCHSAGKTAQMAGEILGVPYRILDIPQRRDEDAVKYLAAQMMDAIDWMVKVTGKEYHDELLVTATEQWWEQAVLLAHIGEVNKAVPAPLDQGMLHDLTLPRGDPEVTEFYRMVLAEVEDRARDGISAHGIETARLSHEGEHMYFAEDFLPDLALRYGAVFIVGYGGLAGGAWNIDHEGRWTPCLSLAEQGLRLKGREDAVKFLAEGMLLHQAVFRQQRGWEKVGEVLNRAVDWKLDGVVLHLDLGCHNQVGIRLEVKHTLEEAGIPAFTYEASNGDPRDFAPQALTDQFEAFLERLGLVSLDESFEDSSSGESDASEAVIRHAE